MKTSSTGWDYWGILRQKADTLVWEVVLPKQERCSSISISREYTMNPESGGIFFRVSVFDFSALYISYVNGVFFDADYDLRFANQYFCFYFIFFFFIFWFVFWYVSLFFCIKPIWELRYNFLIIILWYFNSYNQNIFNCILSTKSPYYG